MISTLDPKGKKPAVAGKWRASNPPGHAQQDAVGVLGLYAAGQSGWGTLAMVATGFEGGRGFLHMLCECLRVSVSVGVGVGVSCQ